MTSILIMFPCLLSASFLPGDTNLVLREFEKCGIVLRHVPGPRDANWMHILYQVIIANLTVSALIMYQMSVPYLVMKIFLASKARKLFDDGFLCMCANWSLQFILV